MVVPANLDTKISSIEASNKKTAQSGGFFIATECAFLLCAVIQTRSDSYPI